MSLLKIPELYIMSETERNPDLFDVGDVDVERLAERFVYIF